MEPIFQVAEKAAYADIFENGLLSFLTSSAIIIATSLILVFIVDQVFKSRKRHGRNSYTFVKSLINTAIYSLMAIGVVWRIVPFKNITLSVVAGSGVIAIAIGLASQEAVANLVGGFLISVFKPFAVGERITINGMTGTVELINIRQTVLLTPGNTRLVIPNSVINNSTIENMSSVDTKINNFLNIDIPYDADVRRAMAILREVVGACPNAIDMRSDDDRARGKPKTEILCSEFGEYFIRLQASIWTATALMGFDVLSDIRLRLLARFREEGIGQPYPYRNIVSRREG